MLHLWAIARSTQRVWIRASACRLSLGSGKSTLEPAPPSRWCRLPSAPGLPSHDHSMAGSWERPLRHWYPSRQQAAVDRCLSTNQVVADIASGTAFLEVVLSDFGKAQGIIKPRKARRPASVVRWHLSQADFGVELEPGRGLRSPSPMGCQPGCLRYLYKTQPSYGVIIAIRTANVSQMDNGLKYHPTIYRDIQAYGKCGST